MNIDDSLEARIRLLLPVATWSGMVETMLGWKHNITDIGPDEMVVLHRAYEAFDPGKPDTIRSKVIP